MSTDQRPRRKNGLEPPYTTAQLSTWVTLPVLIVEFCLFASPILPLAASIPCTVIFVIMSIASTYFAYMAMSIDPSDPRLGTDADAHGHAHTHSHNHNDAQPQEEQHGGNGQAKRWDENEATKHCWICDQEVAQKSMHCKFCNKCVDHFDHHCMWLNTCVGKANYAYFYRTMVSITAVLTLHIGPQIYLILDIYLGDGDTEERAEDWLSAGSVIPVVVVLGVFIGFDLIALSLILQLLNFHHRLQREGLTTYAFIVRENQNKRTQKQRDEVLQSRRDAAMLAASDEGNTCRWMQLKLGGICRETCDSGVCDPLDYDDGESAPPASGTAPAGTGDHNHHQQQHRDADSSDSDDYNNGFANGDAGNHINGNGNGVNDEYVDTGSFSDYNDEHGTNPTSFNRQMEEQI